MSSIVLGVGASHSTLMNTHWAEVDHLPAAHEFKAGLQKAAELIRAAKPDAIVILGSNHFRGFFLDLMPAITIGVSECLGAGEAGTPAGRLPVDTALARRLAFSLVDRGFDPAFSLRLTVDHGITHSLQHLVPDLDVPIVPIVINMFAPPLPTLGRIHNLGTAIGDIVGGDEDGKRVVVIASGGLSHRLPWPKWFETFSDDDRFLVDAWLNGRDSWSQYEVRRREIIRAAQPQISPDFDRRLLDLLEAGDTAALRDMSLATSSADLEEQAGNGAQEIRSWIAMAASLGPFRGTTLAYAPIEEWLTGMGVLVAEPLAAATGSPAADPHPTRTAQGA
jgi:2,3-dihydroxyphenylpropionate 1,2-dioxygenase